MDRLPTIWSESDDSDDPCSDKGEPRGHLKREIEHEIQLLNDPIPFEMVMKKRTQKDWKKAERKRSWIQ